MILNHHHADEDITGYRKTIVNLNNIPIENVANFRYLGDEIRYNVPCIGDTVNNLRINLAANKFY